MIESFLPNFTTVTNHFISPGLKGGTPINNIMIINKKRKEKKTKKFSRTLRT
jgi:hypothetical protein